MDLRHTPAAGGRRGDDSRIGQFLVKLVSEKPGRRRSPGVAGFLCKKGICSRRSQVEPLRRRFREPPPDGSARAVTRTTADSPGSMNFGMRLETGSV